MVLRRWVNETKIWFWQRTKARNFSFLNLSRWQFKLINSYVEKPAYYPAKKYMVKVWSTLLIKQRLIENNNNKAVVISSSAIFLRVIPKSVSLRLKMSRNHSFVTVSLSRLITYKLLKPKNTAATWLLGNSSISASFWDPLMEILQFSQISREQTDTWSLCETPCHY